MAERQPLKSNEGESSTIVVDTEETEPGEPASARMMLKKPKSKKKVAWSSDTVDNEHMDKKKSKCCCIYEKPKAFGESSSESEDECEHCKGHTDHKRKQPKENPSQDENHSQPIENKTE
ncbi:hypothetical protein JTE90_001379 [Oedothorax gibbosus]|uniref:E3 ubiquitin-protein ligase PPP1R11 n=1 Tax=Oedothorax gibbosus TaxID=931172 RepID=A0AAV6VEX2_9ARAC|nr:hypothetical protein JTE90_001379 [Oedothorax gibbosus]